MNLNNCKCKNCYSDRTIIKKKGPHIGAYCADCGTWITWLSKKEYADIIANAYHFDDIDSITVQWKEKEVCVAPTKKVLVNTKHGKEVIDELSDCPF